MLELIGLAGALIVTYSNLPQIWLFIKKGNADGISLSSTWLGLIGVLFRTIYLIYSAKANFIVLGPYFFAIGCILVTLYYCYFPCKRQ